MSLMQKLCEAYDAGICCDQSKEAVPLMPVGFVRKKIKFHVILTLEGEFVSANELAGKDQFMEIPSTPQAESRTGDNVAPFPLAEQLKYLIYEERNKKRFTQYMQQLDKWCKRPGTPLCLSAVHRYLSKHTLLADLESQPNLKLKYYKNHEKREGVGEDTKSMVCFSVQMKDGSCDDLWMRKDVKESWNACLLEFLSGDKGLCYVEGKVLPIMESHPKLQGNAKLISAKDTEFPFQYKGRFVEDRSAALVSFDASVRAHNALSWLIERQGMQKYGMIWVAWNTNGAMMKVPIDEGGGFGEEEESEESDSKPIIDTFAGYAKEVRSAASGYGGRLREYDNKRRNCAVILGLEAATDGRMSVTYYQECPGNEYIQRLENWYKDCCWWHYSEKKNRKELSSPRPNEIATAVMGIDAIKTARQDKKCEKSYTKLMRRLQSEILTCMIDERRIPLNVVRSAFYRVCAPLAFVSGRDRKWSRFAWESSVDTACALIHCFQRRNGGKNELIFSPELNEDSKNPDYLYGRLLAVADFVEERASEREKDYPTNAVRLMQRFVQRPFETWPEIHDKLIPSFRKLGAYSKIYQIILERIEGQFSGRDRYERGELSLEFLQGFSSQRQHLFQKWEKGVKNGDTEKVLYELPKRRSELYGCFLAIADAAEREADDEDRTGKTNAIQMMPQFAARPYESWSRLHDKLIPYLERLGERADYYGWLIRIVEMQFSQPDRDSNVPLDGSFLHGYYCMLRTFYGKTQFSWESQEWTESRDPRSALFGKMLGIAGRLEKKGWDDCTEEEKKFSNTMRFMTIFAQKPASTWENLKEKLNPYRRAAGFRGTMECEMLEQLEVELKKNGWDTNASLSSIYLHAYYREQYK